MNSEPSIAIGIVLRPNLRFTLYGTYILSENGYPYQYEQYIEINDNHILFNGDYYDEINLIPVSHQKTCYFTLSDVVIGIDFHWQRKENQSFNGSLRFIIENGQLRAVNIIHVEDYLKSVISSEMSATSNEELLKAHAVISRSWVLSQLNKKSSHTQSISFVSKDKIIRWYDRDDHHLFDVCADDHCQRYQGITRITAPLVEKAVQLTRAEVLISDHEICDARFSKCCGGISEKFENCWKNTSYPYLQPVYDAPEGMKSVRSGLNNYFHSQSETLPIDLTKEVFAEAWISTSPMTFCNTTDSRILSQVLNNYDQETHDFFRWTVSYSQEELSALLYRRSGIDFGQIIDLIPINRGASGRIVHLKIVGTKRTMIIGKELEIRKYLSESHLYSSAFIVQKTMGTDNLPKSFTLTGAGWGHGVGLCQIGAAVMSEKGYSYREILAHYFRGAEIQKQYD